ncbi:two-component sensor protein RcsC [Klebsiella michiganensis]|nr:two-component sensor protein RcsC [Klebsiella michiganensis]
MLTHEDRQRLTQIICGQQVNFVDVLTSNNTNLQISFVHSRYRNENVAICVLVDVSARVKMEESLRRWPRPRAGQPVEIMFLATVSHELERRCTGLSVTSIYCRPKATEGRRSSGDGMKQLFQPAAENY